MTYSAHSSTLLRAVSCWEWAAHFMPCLSVSFIAVYMRSSALWTPIRDKWLWDYILLAAGLL